MKERLLVFLSELTLRKGIIEDEGFTSIYLANEFGLSRNLISQYLNELVKEGKLVKINSRPVYFFEVSSLEKLGLNINNSVYNSIYSLSKSGKDFNKLIGCNGSLSAVIEQCKAAINYPPNGLPILLLGQTGTGKSIIANTMYEYAVNKKIIDSKKRMISVNCSEYADNPELFTSNLFGHKKGSFTGADRDNPGLIKLADGGVLFLDEVHCLKAECQEKLFMFMDKGMYHMVGDNDNWYHSDCRLIFATTEQPENVLLKTLLRRIPISVNIPPLKERGGLEKQELVSFVIKKEAKEIKKEIKISQLAYQILMTIELPGNVGGLLNCIKATCANAFLRDQDNNGVLEIYSYNLPPDILKLVPTFNFKLHDKDDLKMLNVMFSNEKFNYDSQLIELYDKVINHFVSFNDYRNKELINGDLLEIVEISSNYLIFNNNQNIAFEYTKKIVDKIFSIMINKFSIKISNNDIVLITKYIIEVSKNNHNLKQWLIKNKKDLIKLDEFLNLKYSRDYSIVNEISTSIHLNLDIELDIIMKFILLIKLKDFNSLDKLNDTVAIILCHGYSTASSIASSVNKMLGVNVFDAIDMQLDLSIEKTVEQLNNYLSSKTNYKDLILLVDMGSLEDIYKFTNKINSSMIIVNNVNTKTALIIGSAIKNEEDVYSIIKSLNETEPYQYKYIDEDIKKEVILSVCATGLGSANKIKNLFEDSLPEAIPINIITYDYQKLVNNGLNDPVFDKYDVKFIIGTMNPCIENIPFIAVEDLLLNVDAFILDELVSKYFDEEKMSLFKNNIMKNFTLNNIVNYLTILNAEKVIEDVEIVINSIENRLGKFEAGIKMGLFVHLACMIERLILRNEFVIDNRDNITADERFIEIVKEAFSVVKNRYSVDIPDPEIIYMYKYIYNQA